MAPDDLLLKRIDHLVYATPDLEASVTDLEKQLGVRAAAGGRHPGRGTRNALLGLGNRSYLEIVGPDPSQDSPRWFGIDTMTNPRLTTWAANAANLDEVISQAARNGLRLGAITAGQRVRSDGVVLSWKFTDPITTVADGLVPFFIDWGRSPHPAESAPRGVQLISMRGEHPQPHRVIEALTSVDIPLRADYGPEPSLIAVLKTSKGLVELR
jgi:hypothetical protein